MEKKYDKMKENIKKVKKNAAEKDELNEEESKND